MEIAGMIDNPTAEKAKEIKREAWALRRRG
jgi:hypothetical protein